MPFHPIADTAKVEIFAHHSSTLIPIVNVLHCVEDSGNLPQSVQDIATTVETWIHGHLHFWANEWVYEQTVATDLTTFDGPQYTANAHAGDVGSQGIGAPANSCLLFKFTTGERSRRGRGRMYVSPIAADDIDANGAISSALLTQASTDMDALQTALAGHSFHYTLCVASYAGSTSYPVTGGGPETLIASQRRRIAR
jgi:hypothetical protein